MPVVPVQESPLKAFPVEPCNVVGLTGENSNVKLVVYHVCTTQTRIFTVAGKCT
jgi:hypothetical protein